MITPLSVAHSLYARRLRRQIVHLPRPRHVGIIMDGNRRWARRAGLPHPSLGHRYGAEHLDDLLAWCEAAHISHVTAFVCSTENLLRREDDEVAFLMQVIEDLAHRASSATPPRWALHVAGLLDLLPDSTASALKTAAETTGTATATGQHLTLAIGYGGRQEIVDAVSSLLLERSRHGDTPSQVAANLTPEEIAEHLYTPGLPEPDLVIRTSGEQRLSNFLLWQAAYSELYFCDTLWPAFREIDFLRALRTYGTRQRRFGR